MKKVYIEVQVKNQVQQTIRDTFAGVNQSIHPILFGYPVTQLRLPAEARAGDFNIFLTQNKGKGPPGRTRSPGKARGHPPKCWEDKPENKAGPPQGVPLSLRRGGPGVSSLPNPIVCQNQIISYKKQNLIFYKHLIFSIMKKQILFLALFSLVLFFAGTNMSYGQVTYTQNLTGAPACTPAIPLTCPTGSDALHPLPGATYTYSVTVNPAIAGTGTILWFVTDQATVIDGSGATPVIQPSRDAQADGTYILLAESPIYNNAANTDPSIDISWKYFDGLTNQVILVAYVMDNAGCTNNVEVYRIEPTFGFTLDIAGLFDGGTLPTVGSNANECVSPVESATYDGTSLTMNYGENWVFFSVNAANFVNSWMPNIQNLGYTGAGTVDLTSLQWAYPADAVANTAWNATTVPVLAQDASGAVGPTGECIVVRARVVHAADELDTPTGGAALTLGIDGTMYDPAAAVGSEYTNTSLRDLDEGAPACVNTVTDQAVYDLDPRPELTSTTVGVAPNPNPGPFEPKN